MTITNEDFKIVNKMHFGNKKYNGDILCLEKSALEATLKELLYYKQYNSAFYEELHKVIKEAFPFLEEKQ